MTASDAPTKGDEPRPRPSRGAPIFAVLLVMVAASTALGVRVQVRHRVGKERDAREQELAKGPRVEVVTVETTAAERVVRFPGEARGYQQTTLYAKLAGYVSWLGVDRGDAVKKGQVVAAIASPESDQDVRAAISDYAAKLATARHLEDLQRQGVVSLLDRIAADNSARIAEATLQRTRSLTAYELVRAPFDGVITARYVDVGALAPAATGTTQAAQPIFDVAIIDRLRVFVYLGQDLANHARLGDTVVVQQDEGSGERVDAKISRTTGSLDPRTRTMQCEIDVENKPRRILPGAFVTVELHLQMPQAALVPAEALVVRDGKDLVAVVDAGHVRFQEVGIDFTDGRTTRIARGLHGGEQVAVNVPVELQDGAAVQIVARPPAQAAVEKRP